MKRVWGENLIGETFGRLTVTSLSEPKNGHRYWFCKCSCGNEKEVSGGILKRGDVKSCGCLRSETAREAVRNLKPRQRKDISGKKFGKLTALNWICDDRNRKPVWECICECGNISYVGAYDLAGGNSKSCGCQKINALSKYVEEKKKNGFGIHHKRARNSWRLMIDRCTNPKNKDYPNYGGRGINVCDEWLTLKNFVLDMGDPPLGMTIDRADTNGNYEPENCRWATPKEQARNTRKNVLVKHGDRIVTVMELSELTGIPASTIYSRVSRGAIPL